MTTKTRNPAPENYVSSEGLRRVLNRLHQQGAGAWQHDPVAADLMGFAADKYAALARRHGLDPWEAASAAFDVMRLRSTRLANDPWAVVTRGVQITCIAEERGQGLLCSTNKARRPHISQLHDPERISDRETPLSDYHPAFHFEEDFSLDDEPETDVFEDPAQTATQAVAECVSMLTGLGWPEDVALHATEYVCEALARLGNRSTAYESLRRDRHALAFLDLPRTSWTALLRALLGNPSPALCATPAGRGVLLRLVVGEPLRSILRDDDLVLAIAMNAPKQGR